MKHYHFIGIGGIGMSALANILVQKGIKVSGSDLSASALTESLKKAGAEVVIGHRSETVQPCMTIVYNSQVAQENPEFKKAQELGLPLLHRSDMLAELMEGSQPLLVAGTHGKTTTSSLLAHTLVSAGLHPSYAIGGIVGSLGTNGSYGTGRYFVAESDESDGTFLKYSGLGAIITNIDNDHYDYWKNESNLLDGFRLFASQVKSEEHLFWCVDDPLLASLELKGHGYGFAANADLHVSSFHQERWKNLFDLRFEEREYRDIALPLIGAHNVLNAAAVFGLCLKLGLSEESIRQGLATFQGIGRRAEKKGEKKEISFYDDYGHHPTEIFATLRAMKAAVGKHRLVVVFQPHRYTRTRDCLEQFPEAFHAADELIITDIYAAMEPPIEGITAELLLKKIQNKRKSKVHYAARSQLAAFLKGFLKPGDVLLTMGAGDVTKIGPELLSVI